MGTGLGPEREFTVESRTQRQMVRAPVLPAPPRDGQPRRADRFIVLLAFVGLRLWKHPYDASGTLVDGGRPTLDLIPWLDGDGLRSATTPSVRTTIGRDYFAVTLRGTQQSIVIALVAGVVATVIGTIVGGLAGFYRGWVDSVLMRLVDVLFTIPLLLVAAVLSRSVRLVSIFVLALIIALASWLTTARIIRAEFMSLAREGVRRGRARPRCRQRASCGNTSCPTWSDRSSSPAPC
jgi:hypothetical protein